MIKYVLEFNKTFKVNDDLSQFKCIQSYNYFKKLLIQFNLYSEHTSLTEDDKNKKKSLIDEFKISIKSKIIEMFTIFKKNIHLYKLINPDLVKKPNNPDYQISAIQKIVASKMNDYISIFMKHNIFLSLDDIKNLIDFIICFNNMISAYIQCFKNTQNLIFIKYDSSNPETTRQTAIPVIDAKAARPASARQIRKCRPLRTLDSLDSLEPRQSINSDPSNKSIIPRVVWISPATGGGDGQHSIKDIRKEQLNDMIAELKKIDITYDMEKINFMENNTFSITQYNNKLLGIILLEFELSNINIDLDNTALNTEKFDLDTKILADSTKLISETIKKEIEKLINGGEIVDLFKDLANPNILSASLDFPITPRNIYKNADMDLFKDKKNELEQKWIAITKKCEKYSKDENYVKCNKEVNDFIITIKNSDNIYHQQFIKLLPQSYLLSLNNKYYKYKNKYIKYKSKYLKKIESSDLSLIVNSNIENQNFNKLSKPSISKLIINTKLKDFKPINYKQKYLKYKMKYLSI
uniref:Uncharacterized protein n=1 Tax=viral metagenome TaxID=1070528 RepID=A0A6C0ED24_9ZZZZ